eukprot:6130204-Pyramimonas_sp.AAC.1
MLWRETGTPTRSSQPRLIIARAYRVLEPMPCRQQNTTYKQLTSVGGDALNVLPLPHGIYADVLSLSDSLHGR